MRELSWGVWLVRLGITMFGAGVISFWVADYVVRANTSGTIEAMRSLQSSIDRLNESVIANSGRLDALTSNTTTLMERTATTTTEIAALRDDVARVKSAVQDAGIDIRIGSGAEGRKLDFSLIREISGVGENEPFYLQFGGDNRQ